MKQGTTKNVNGKRTIGDSSNASHESPLRKSLRGNPTLYGLPCSHCKIYYEADFDACPLCGCTDRVSPTQTSTAAYRASGGAA